MNSEQIDLVQASFAKVAPIAPMAAGLFYGRLFEIAPEVKPLFKGEGDMDEQGRKLMATLGLVVKGLRQLGEIVPVAQRLAVRHVDFGVKAEHYAPVGSALDLDARKGPRRRFHACGQGGVVAGLCDIVGRDDIGGLSGDGCRVRASR